VMREPCAGFVSGLPLFTKPMEQRLDLIEAALDLARPGAPFIQFTYAVVPPVPSRSTRYVATASERIWRNVPPARVWVYRRP
jgi:phosphatidylethanolamine/phosphatidyl-N-methylethanolamine N-methyltransferase